jgi:hypothetical protein
MIVTRQEITTSFVPAPVMSKAPLSLVAQSLEDLKLPFIFLGSDVVVEGRLYRRALVKELFIKWNTHLAYYIKEEVTRERAIYTAICIQLSGQSDFDTLNAALKSVGLGELVIEQKRLKKIVFTVIKVLVATGIFLYLSSLIVHGPPLFICALMLAILWTATLSLKRPWRYYSMAGILAYSILLLGVNIYLIKEIDSFLHAVLPN